MLSVIIRDVCINPAIDLSVGRRSTAEALCLSCRAQTSEHFRGFPPAFGQCSNKFCRHFILQERLTGRSARSIAKQLSLPVSEVNAALDRTLPQLDNAARLRHISLDLSRLDGLLETFYKLAIEKQDIQAALCVVKILERKARLLGLDQPTKLDVVQVQALREAIMRIARPGWQPGDDDGAADGAVDGLSGSNGTEKKH